MAIIAPDIGIDLGTSNTLVYVKHKGVVLNEPTLMVVTGGQKKSVKAFGEDARLMLGRTTGEYQSVRPLEDGVIKDYDMTEYMLEFFIRKAIGMSRLVRPRGLITIPSRVTAIERRAVREAAENAGIRKGALHLIEKPFAAALGSGLPVFEPRGSMVVDIGGGTSEIACISLGGIVCSESINTAGDVFTNDIQSYVRQQHNIRIGERTAEAIKCAIGAAIPKLEEEPEDFTVTGPNMLTALPQSVTLNYNEIAYALEKSLIKLDAALMKVLETMPPELYADIVKNGIYLAGGGALIKGLDRRLTEKTGLPFHIAEDPLRAIARGTGIALKNIDRFSFLMK